MTLSDALAYLRAVHSAASRNGQGIIANDIAADIADLVQAEAVLEKLDDERSGCCIEATHVAA